MSDNHKDDDLPSTSNCGNCDYKSDEESEMKLHIESNHSFKCKTCHKIFSSELSLKSHVEDKHATPKTLECETCSYICNTAEKLEKHMCRITVRNPSFCDLYTKNWIVLNRCTYIYHRIEKREVALLHCKDCMDNKNRCMEKYPLWLPAQEDKEDGIWHLDLSNFLKDGRLEWPALKTLVKK